MEVVKKYFISNRPRGVCMYLLEVARETVDSCTPIASATVFEIHRPQAGDALDEKRILAAHDLARRR